MGRLRNTQTMRTMRTDHLGRMGRPARIHRRRSSAPTAKRPGLPREPAPRSSATSPPSAMALRIVVSHTPERSAAARTETLRCTSSMGSDTTKTLMHLPTNECRAPHMVHRMRDDCPLDRLGLSSSTLLMDRHLGHVSTLPTFGSRMPSPWTSFGRLPNMASPLSPAPSFFGLLFVAIVVLLWAKALDCGHRKRLALAVGPVCVGANR